MLSWKSCIFFCNPTQLPNRHSQHQQHNSKKGKMSTETPLLSNFDEKEAKRRLENRDISKIGLKFFTGGLSATLVSMSLNSTDHVKTRLQIQQKPSILNQSGLMPYKSFGEAFGRIFREEGIVIVCVFLLFEIMFAFHL